MAGEQKSNKTTATKREATKDEDETGFEQWGGYMNAKKQKLMDQFHGGDTKQTSTAAADGSSRGSTIFKGVSIHVNGYTDPSADELRHLIVTHGGEYHAYRSSRTTHVVAVNLPYAKRRKLTTADMNRYVRPQWISDSCREKCLLDWKVYRLYVPSVVNKQQSVGDMFEKDAGSVLREGESSSNWNSAQQRSAVIEIDDIVEKKDTFEMVGVLTNELTSASQIACQQLEENSEADNVTSSAINTECDSPSDNLLNIADIDFDQVRPEDRSSPDLFTDDDYEQQPGEENLDMAVLDERNAVAPDSPASEEATSVLGFELTETSNTHDVPNVQHKNAKSKLPSPQKQKVIQVSPPNPPLKPVPSPLISPPKPVPSPLISPPKPVPSPLNSPPKPVVSPLISPPHSVPSPPISPPKPVPSPLISPPKPVPHAPPRGVALKAGDPNYMNEFYAHSRLHHISTMATTFKQYVQRLRAEGGNTGAAQRPGVKLLRDLVASGKLESVGGGQRKDDSSDAQSANSLGDPVAEAVRTSAGARVSGGGEQGKDDSSDALSANSLGNPGAEAGRTPAVKGQSYSSNIDNDGDSSWTVGSPAVMHIDMDCFFVSVGVRHRPELKGHPVAVTHSKRGSRTVDNSSVEQEVKMYRQRRQEKSRRAGGKADGDELDEDALDDDVNAGFCRLYDLSSSDSLSEIASCNYEARNFTS